MKEISCGSGGNCGGTQIDKNFIDFVISILGKKFVKSFEKDCPSDWFNFMTEFELKKKATNLGSTTGITMQLSWSMAEKYTQITGLKIQDTIQENSHKGISFKSGNIVFSQDVVRAFFNPVIENIISHIQSQLDEHPQLGDLDYFLLVGGFAESNILYERLESAFSTTAHIISPHSAGLAIIKGAVTFGHNPKAIVERIARKTYGQSICLPFDYEKHDLKKQFWHEEEETNYCKQIFEVLMEKGQTVKCEDVKSFYLAPLYSTSKSVQTRILSSDRKDIVYSDEPGIEEIGRLKIDVPLSLSKRRIETKVYFGSTEIEIQLSDISRKNGDSAKCQIDFLTDKVEYYDDDYD